MQLSPLSPLDQASGGYQLTDDDLAYLRRVLIRDEFVPGYGSTPASAISRFNQANRANFFEDSDLQLICDRVIGDQLEELDAAYHEKYSERIFMGDAEDVAQRRAGAAQNVLLLSLIAAEAIDVEIRDPGYRTAIAVGQGGGIKDLIDQMTNDASKLRKFAKSRSAEYAMIDLERK